MIAIRPWKKSRTPTINSSRPANEIQPAQVSSLAMRAPFAECPSSRFAREAVSPACGKDLRGGAGRSRGMDLSREDARTVGSEGCSRPPPTRMSRPTGRPLAAGTSAGSRPYRRRLPQATAREPPEMRVRSKAQLFLDSCGGEDHGECQIFKRVEST